MNKKILALSFLLLTTLETVSADGARNFENWLNSRLGFKSSEELNNDLLVAAVSDNIPLIKKLISQGADVNSQQFTLDVTEWQEYGFYGEWAKRTITKQTILMKLAQLGQVNPKIITFLISAGANRSLKDSRGNTEQYYLNESLLQAALDGDIASMKNLIARGADVNSQQFYSEIHRPIGTYRVANNQTILMKLRIAQQNALPAEVINTLINAGADLTLKDSEGRTADDSNTSLIDLYSLILCKLDPPKNQTDLDKALKHKIKSSYFASLYGGGTFPKTILYLLSLGANINSDEVKRIENKKILKWFFDFLLANNLMNESK